MKNLNLLDNQRDRSARTLFMYHSFGDDTCGVFNLRSPIDGAPIFVIASSGEGWEHVSVSRKSRCPNWIEMEYVKRQFFNDDETVVQFHVPSAEHINCHPFCLHLWRPTEQTMPRPPAWLVGPNKRDTAVYDTDPQASAE